MLVYFEGPILDASTAFSLKHMIQTKPLKLTKRFQIALIFAISHSILLSVFMKSVEPYNDISNEKRNEYQ